MDCYYQVEVPREQKDFQRTCGFAVKVVRKGSCKENNFGVSFEGGIELKRVCSELKSHPWFQTSEVGAELAENCGAQ